MMHRQVANTLSLLGMIMMMLPLVLSQNYEYDVRIVGGSKPTTGIIEMYFDGQWGVLCSTTWTIVEADMACRQAGYGGALINEGFLSDGYTSPSSTPIHKGTLNCTGQGSPRGPHSLLGCRKSFVTENTICSWPNSVACTIHQAELSVRLFGGHSSSSGRVEVSYGGIWWGICPARWSLMDATVVCQQLKFTHSAGFADSATVRYPAGHEDRLYLMSNVNCTGEESNIGLCGRVYGTRKCAEKDYAKADCATKKTGRVFNKTVLVTLLCLFLIPAFHLVLFLVVLCVYRKRKDAALAEQRNNSIYKPVVQKESMDMQPRKNPQV